MSTLSHQQSIRNSHYWISGDPFKVSDALRAMRHKREKLSVERARTVLRDMVGLGQLTHADGFYRRASVSIDLMAIPWVKTDNGHRLGCHYP